LDASREGEITAELARSVHCDKKGDLRDYRDYCTIYYYPNGIANILSLSNVKKKYRATFNSEQEDGFLVHN